MEQATITNPLSGSNKSPTKPCLNISEPVFIPSSLNNNINSNHDISPTLEVDKNYTVIKDFNNNIAITDNEILQTIFFNFKNGLIIISEFANEFSSYLNESLDYYSNKNNYEKSSQDIIKRFKIADINLDYIFELQKLTNKDIKKPEKLEKILKNDLEKNSLIENYFKANQSLFEKLKNSIEIPNPRFKNVKNDLVNFDKINKDLKKSLDILNSYEKKINKLNEKCNSIRENNQKDSIMIEHHNMINFTIFLVLKLIKFDILEFFLFIRDSISMKHEIWKIINFREIYKNLFETFMYLNYCSNLINSSKQQNLSINLVLNNNNKINEDVKIDVFTNLTPFEFFKQFSTKNESFKKNYSRIKNFIKEVNTQKNQFHLNFEKYYLKILENLGEFQTEKILRNDNILTYNLINQLYQQENLLENILNLILNFHLRYLKLIEKFINENKDSNFFKTNLLPISIKSNNDNIKKKFSSNNKFETLINLIKLKINKNINKLKLLNDQLIDNFLDADYKILSIEKFNILKRIPNILITAMLIFDDSFNYIFSISPLFPIDNYNSLIPPKKFINKKKKYQSKILTSSLMPLRFKNSRKDISNRQQINQLKIQEKSFLSTSWFINEEISKKFFNLIHINLKKYGSYLNEIKSIEVFFNNLYNDDDSDEEYFGEFNFSNEMKIFLDLKSRINKSFEELLESIENHDDINQLNNYIIF